MLILVHTFLHLCIVGTDLKKLNFQKIMSIKIVMGFMPMMANTWLIGKELGISIVVSSVDQQYFPKSSFYR